MSLSLTAALSGLPAIPSAFATEFAHAMIAAGLVTPLVPTDGTDFAALTEPSQSLTKIYIAHEKRKQLAMLWAGKDSKTLPPAKRFLPRLFKMPGVSSSKEDLKAMEKMGYYRNAQPRSVIHLSSERGADDWTPSFYKQLEFMDGLVSLTVDNIINGGELSKNPQEAAQLPSTIVDKREIRALQQRLFGHVYQGPFFDLVSAAILATSRDPEDRITAATMLSEASIHFKAMDLKPLSAIALETSWNLLVSAYERLPLLFDHSEPFMTAQMYLHALNDLQDPNQDPLGYSVMLTRGLTISMNGALQSLASDVSSNDFFEQAHEFSKLSYMWHAANGIDKEAAADTTRLVWLAGQLELPDYWNTSEKLIDGIASLLGRSGESRQNILGVWNWAEAARRIRRGETS